MEPCLTLGAALNVRLCQRQLVWFKLRVDEARECVVARMLPG
jgi:hypothetical protein